MTFAAEFSLTCDVDRRLNIEPFLTGLGADWIAIVSSGSQTYQQVKHCIDVV